MFEVIGSAQVLFVARTQGLVGSVVLALACVLLTPFSRLSHKVALIYQCDGEAPATLHLQSHDVLQMLHQSWLNAGLEISKAELSTGVGSPGPDLSALVYESPEACPDVHVHHFIVVNHLLWTQNFTEHPSASDVQLSNLRDGSTMVSTRYLHDVFI